VAGSPPFKGEPNPSNVLERIPGEIRDLSGLRSNPRKFIVPSQSQRTVHLSENKFEFENLSRWGAIPQLRVKARYVFRYVALFIS
jgi:hypothetical protein